MSLWCVQSDSDDDRRGHALCIRRHPPLLGQAGSDLPLQGDYPPRALPGTRPCQLRLHEECKQTGEIFILLLLGIAATIVMSCTNWCAQDYVLTRDVAKEGDVVMMTDEENERSIHFWTSSIHTQISKEWQNDDHAVWRRFFEVAGQYVVSPGVERQWSRLLERVEANAAHMHQIRHERGLLRYALQM